MKVEVRLHAVLRELIAGGAGSVELDGGSTVTDLLDRLGVEAELRELVTVNGEQVKDLSHMLSDGDRVEVFPAVSGGWEDL